MNCSNPESCTCEAPTKTQTAPAEQRLPTYRPNVDIVETASEFTIVADVPGARPDAIDVTLEGGVLTLKAGVAQRAAQTSRPLVSEYGVGNYERTFKIGEGIDADNLTATLKHGVLTLRLPKAEPERRKIQVRTN